MRSLSIRPDYPRRCRIELYWIKAAPPRGAAGPAPRRRSALGGPRGARRATPRELARSARLIRHAPRSTLRGAFLALVAVSLQIGVMPRHVATGHAPGHPGAASGDDHLAADDHGNCKGPPPDCRRIMTRLRYGIKGGCARRTTSTGNSAWLMYTRSRS